MYSTYGIRLATASTSPPAYVPSYGTSLSQYSLIGSVGFETF